MWCGVAYCVVSFRHNFRHRHHFHMFSFPFFLVVIHCPVTVNRSRAHVCALVLPWCFCAAIVPSCHCAIVVPLRFCAPVVVLCSCFVPLRLLLLFFFFQCFSVSVFPCFHSFVICHLSFTVCRLVFVPFAVPELSLLWSVSGGLCARFRTTEKLPNSQTPELGKLEGTEPSIPPSNWAATTRHKTRKKISQKMDEYKIRQKISQK